MASHSIADFVFVGADGEDVREPGPDVAALEIRFTDDAFENVTVSFADLPANAKIAAGWHGLKRKLGDFTNASSRNKDDSERYDGTLALIERLMAGDWLKEREAVGPRTSLLFEAIVRHMTAKRHEPDDAKREEIREAITNKDTGKAERERALENAGVKLAYETIKIERQSARIAKLETAAGEAGDDLPF